MSALLRSRTFSVLLVSLGLVAAFSALSPGHSFLSPGAVQITLVTVPEFCIVVLGIGVLMIAGEFDLSVPSTLLICSLVFLDLFRAKLDIVLVAAAVLIVGLLIGFINGIITTKAHIPSFITTLGTLLLWQGVTNIFVPSGEARGVTNLPSVFVNVLTGSLFGVPSQFLWFVALAIVFGVLLHFHKFGYWVYATGDNKEAARAMGINTDRVKITCFMIVGLLGSFSAILQVIRTNAFFPGIATGWNLNAIVAAVIGGADLFGGAGNMIGLVLGGFTLIVIENGMVMMGINTTLSWLIYGAILLSFVTVSEYLEKLTIKTIYAR